MKCIICDNEMKFFLRKEFDAEYNTMISMIEYYKCNICGFTFSPTIAKLDSGKFSRLNIAFHEYIESTISINKTHQPPYIEQAVMLNILNKNKVIDLKDPLDFAGGYGTMNKILRKYFYDISFLIYDPFMQEIESNKYIAKNDLKKYKTVFCSAFFEHITNRQTLDEINQCVDEDGVLILHTVICENIPNDPDWFYINPVHSAFHTNKSMQNLMKQWNYKWSLYCPTAKAWVLFKGDYSNQGEILNSINNEFQTDYFIYNSNGFVDYWKGF